MDTYDSLARDALGEQEARKLRSTVYRALNQAAA